MLKQSKKNPVPGQFHIQFDCIWWMLSAVTENIGNKWRDYPFMWRELAFSSWITIVVSGLFQWQRYTGNGWFGWIDFVRMATFINSIINIYNKKSLNIMKTFNPSSLNTFQFSLIRYYVTYQNDAITEQVSCSIQLVRTLWKLNNLIIM